MSFREQNGFRPDHLENVHDRIAQKKETVPVTESSATALEFASLDKNDIRRLLTIRRDQNWEELNDVRGTIETRDVLEYAAVRNIASVLQETSNRLADIENGGGTYTRAEAEEQFEQLISLPDNGLSTKQKEILQNAKEVVLNNIDQFNEWKAEHTNEDILSLLGNKFARVDQSHLQINADQYPGAIVIEVTDPDTYQLIRDNQSSNGFYSKELGEDELKGRFLVINASQTDTESTARHEYQHFLFEQAADEVEFVPEVSPRKTKAREEKDENRFRSIRTRLQSEKLETEFVAEDEYEDYGQISPETSQKLSTLEDELRTLPNRITSSETAREAAFGTYPDGPIRDAFQKFRNEVIAYTSGGEEKLRFDAYFGDTLDQAKEDPYFETFNAEIQLVRGVMTFALKKGVSLERIGYLVGSSRNLQQAAKFVFLETQIPQEK